MKPKISNSRQCGAYFAYLPATLVNPTDIADLDGGSVAEITFPNPNDLTSFRVKVKVELWNSVGVLGVFRHLQSRSPTI